MLTLRTQPGDVYSLERTFSLCFKKYVEDFPPLLGLLDILLFEKLAYLVIARGSNIPPNFKYQHLLGATTFESKSPSAQGTQQLLSCCGFGTGHQKPELRVSGANKDWKENHGGDCQGGSRRRGHGGPVAPSSPPLSLQGASQDLKSWCKKVTP